MNRDDVKLAADALGRLEALERALESVTTVIHGALPISFFYGGQVDVDGRRGESDHGIKAYYPRERYEEVINDLIAWEERALLNLGVEA